MPSSSSLLVNRSYCTSVNSLINSIYDLNQAIIRTQGTPEENLMLFDQRDEAIRQLSEKMEIRTVTQPNGSMLVNMSTGHSLVLDGGVAQFKVVPGSPDSRDARLQLTLGANQANINDKDLGGAIGGLFTARNDLEPAKRELGRLAVAMADIDIAVDLAHGEQQFAFQFGGVGLCGLGLVMGADGPAHPRFVPPDLVHAVVVAAYRRYAHLVKLRVEEQGPH